MTKNDNAVAESEGQAPATRRRRADAHRNEQTLLGAAAALFVSAGVNVPVRDIAARAGVGVGTIYRHFPTRADLIIAVYRYQVEACVEAGPVLLASEASPYAALQTWVGLFVDFLVTKHGLAAAMQNDKGGFDTLLGYFLERLVPVCADLLAAARQAGEIRSSLPALELMLGVGSLCAALGKDPAYNPRPLVALLIAGLRQPQ